MVGYIIAGAHCIYFLAKLHSNSQILQLQDSEVQTIHCERSTHELRHALDIKEREASAASQKLQDLLVASSGTNNAIKQLEEHIQR